MVGISRDRSLQQVTSSELSLSLCIYIYMYYLHAHIIGSQIHKQINSSPRVRQKQDAETYAKVPVRTPQIGRTCLEVLKPWNRNLIQVKGCKTTYQIQKHIEVLLKFWHHKHKETRLKRLLQY